MLMCCVITGRANMTGGQTVIVRKEVRQPIQLYLLNSWEVSKLFWVSIVSMTTSEMFQNSASETNEWHH